MRLRSGKYINKLFWGGRRVVGVKFLNKYPLGLVRKKKSKRKLNKIKQKLNQFYRQFILSKTKRSLTHTHTHTHLGGIQRCARLMAFFFFFSLLKWSEAQSNKIDEKKIIKFFEKKFLVYRSSAPFIYFFSFSFFFKKKQKQNKKTTLSTYRLADNYLMLH